MGASFNSCGFKDTMTREQIQKSWAAKVEQDLHENGHSYSGGIGMLGPSIGGWNDLMLADRNAADAWLETNQEKWQSAIAVSYKNKDGVKCWGIGGWCSS